MGTTHRCTGGSSDATRPPAARLSSTTEPVAATAATAAVIPRPAAAASLDGGLVHGHAPAGQALSHRAGLGLGRDHRRPAAQLAGQAVEQRVGDARAGTVGHVAGAVHVRTAAANVPTRSSGSRLR